MALTDHTGLRNRTARPSLAVHNPFSPCTVTHTNLPSGRGNKESPTKRSHLEVPFNSSVGFYSNLILVEKKGGAGQCPVINLASFNKYVKYSHFKMEDLKAVADLLRPGDFVCKLDQKDAYFAIPLHARSQNSPTFNSKGRHINSLVSHLG